MSVRREASTPPEIPGYTYVQLLGMGGFADVFLYRQHMPKRLVAVKVMLAGAMAGDGKERFAVEADIMAQLSHHPSIVTIYQAGVADDGRPYLVMEYCARGGLAAKYRVERMSVPDVLRIGIRLASAVESAHRVGVLHRDIKPANVLITDFGWPALTDFGIAATTGSDTAVGMSIPWSPPELLGSTPAGDARADVYSLAATIYSLLAQRTPFEVANGSNNAADLVARITRAPLPPVGRTDLPVSLVPVLERAMAKDPAARYHSVLALARALQQVEIELSLPGTPLELADDPDDPLESAPKHAEHPADLQATRLRPILSITADGPQPIVSMAPTAQELTAAAEATRAHPLLAVSASGSAATSASAVPSPVVDPSAPLALAPDRRRTARRWRRGLALATTTVVLLGVLVVALKVAAEPDDSASVDPRASADSTLAATEAVPSPTSLAGELDGAGSAVFTWKNPEPVAGDTYLWSLVAAVGSSSTPQPVTTTTVTVPIPDGADEVCIDVSIVRADRRVSTSPASACVG